MQSMAEDTNGNGRKGSAPNNHSVVSATQTPGKLSRTPLLKARGATPMRRLGTAASFLLFKKIFVHARHDYSLLYTTA